MRRAAVKVFLPAVAMLLAVSLVFLGVGAAITGTMPPWRDSVGNACPAPRRMNAKNLC